MPIARLQFPYVRQFESQCGNYLRYLKQVDVASNLQAMWIENKMPGSLLSWPAHPLWLAAWLAHSAYAQCAMSNVRLPVCIFCGCSCKRDHFHQVTACISNLAADNFNAIFLNYYFDYMQRLSSHPTCIASPIVHGSDPRWHFPIKLAYENKNKSKKKKNINPHTPQTNLESLSVCLRRNSRQSVNRFVPICS